MIKSKECSLLGEHGPERGVWLWTGQLVYQRHAQAEFLAIFKNWLAQEGTFFPIRRVFKMSKHDNVRGKIHTHTQRNWSSDVLTSY